MKKKIKIGVVEFYPEINAEKGKKIFEHLRKELAEEDINYKDLINEAKNYSEKVSKKIYENFIEIILKNKGK